MHGRRRALAVLAVWVALVAVAAPLALGGSDHLTGGGFEVPGSGSARTEAALQQGVSAGLRGTMLGAVLVAPRGTPRADYVAALDALQRAARATPEVKLLPQTKEAALYYATQRPGRPVIVPFITGVDEFHAPDVGKKLRRHLGLQDGRHYGKVQLHLIGQGALWAGMVDLTKKDLASAERVGFPVILVILLVVFGSLAAAALPLIMGGVAVLITGGIIELLARHTLMSFYTPNMASMIGLGVAVDYSLFVVVRYREELRDGATLEEARRTAMRTSGIAVAFSGVAVVIALAGLLFVPTAAIRSMAAGAIIVVLVSMLACATLLPALLTVAGKRIKPGRPGGRRFGAWAHKVTARPAAWLAAALALLILLALPLASLRTGDGVLNQFPKDSEVRKGFEAAITSSRGPGEGAPLKILTPPPTLGAAVKLLRADPEVVHTGVRTRTKDKRHILIIVTPRHNPDVPASKELIKRLRRDLPPGTLVGGNTAAQVDFNHAITSSLWKIAAWVLIATFVLLLVMLRSVPLALQAVVANVLSVAASYGVLTTVFVWGWPDGLLGFDAPGYLDTVTIPIVLAVVFGLSMDYEVFLLSRIRERRLQGLGTREAVQDGLASSGSTISGAALIMVAVFGSFALTGVPVIQEVGLGAAVAIAIDATLVRLVLVPAAIALLGDRAWSSRPHGGRTRVPEIVH
jgi:RND superfamily putative drug exporter